MAYAAVSVASTATLIIQANTARQSLKLFNNGSSTVFIGDDTSITTAAAFPLLPNTTSEEDNGGTKLFTGPVYGIVASGTCEVRYWERTALR